MKENVVISLPFLLICWTTFLGSILLLFYIQKLRRREISGIPVLPSNSILGYTHSLIPSHSKGKSHFILYDDTKKYIEKPGLAQYYFLGQHFVVVLDAVLAKQALQTVTGKGFFMQGNTELARQNIINLDTGPEWHIRRKSFRNAFAANSLRYFEGTIKALVDKLVSSFTKFAEAKEIVDVDLFFGKLTIDVICEVGFQYDMNAIENSQLFQDIYCTIRSLFEDFGFSLLPFSSFFLNLPLPVKFLKDHQRRQKDILDFSKLLFTHIYSLNEKGELKENSLAKSLIEFSKLPTIREKDVLSEIILLFIAGFETTAHTLSFFVYSLATNPEVQHKAQLAMDEVSNVKEEKSSNEENNINNQSEKPNATNDSKLIGTGTESNTILLPPYVEAVVKESMRKYPVVSGGSRRRVKQEGGVMLSRTAKDNRPEASYLIPKGSWIVCPSFVIHNSNAAWGSDAQVFNPDRWLPKSSEEGKLIASKESVEVDNCPATTTTTTTAPKSSNDASSTVTCPLSSAAIYAGGGANEGELSFFPFSHGPRNCIGMNLALLEIRITVGELLRRFSFQLADESMKDERNVLETYLTMRPRENLPVIISLR